ncbi:AFG1-like ATPase [Guyanagaster necrorhizus]|uniref:AFG1-like ATPase n=1 Tax=Guyanagaster necrorhizus TaxID=856835 RepID=A0A9P7VUD4_9AGAR|nr:AFG1-like ATPase [Guyanagaster necrorhizus MCA 3950]KAG7447553.1 AFG1-like ATPase [Guyanagaster necrorhizus MCA 3950]
MSSRAARSFVSSSRRQRRALSPSVKHRTFLSCTPSASRPQPIKGRGNSSLAIEPTRAEEQLYASGARALGQAAVSAKTDRDSPTPLVQYCRLIDTGTLRGDEHQTRIIQKLQDLHDELVHYTPPLTPDPSASNSLLSRIFSRNDTGTASPPENVPKGLYLYGDVGTGKTMLMDLFYNTLPSRLNRKRRVHFHAFMIDVHKRLHAAKIAMGHRGGDPIIPVARDLAGQAYVLCFDEFQVTDIADAMILRRLLENLLTHGVVCVITSNRHPDELYKNGIQRSSFIPAIDLLKTHFKVTDLDSGTDYRRIPRALSKVYYHPLTPSNALEINKIFKSLTSQDPSDPVVHNRPLTIWGRTLRIPESTQHIAKFHFEELCGQPLSAADYLEVTRAFHTVFLLDVPKMGLDSKDKARRFITFIDACYESRTKLFVTSEVPIHQVFSSDRADAGKGPSEHMRSVMDDLGLSEQLIGASSMFSGEEEIFAFARACSRLVQMGSKEWTETSERR